jgi:hypothetical protein
MKTFHIYMYVCMCVCVFYVGQQLIQQDAQLQNYVVDLYDSFFPQGNNSPESELSKWH